MEKNTTQFEEDSLEALIDKEPPWIIRNGMLLILGLCLIIFIIAFIIAKFWLTYDHY